ncbi:hypothetical protein [Xenorhabdus szentirmaii]|uniref:Uncharacterized protein n=1 Tax=Xenorhabdus szentirmaii TaxID=290112 RepID=A0AAW3YV43_9GAMM|nr:MULTISPECIES: hypothetical protein [unclassified Xenorhabdus]MBD2793761.1 hypothetical protein [Xenorhabdus sp. CUL]MBD2801166.1 hypothetical protein [Xenorhabdus sp. M]MBD2805476.1 hypothetical protein [Xenorhabdus sp. ZM]MBD2823845.1 hypothetical protein [Xenorhabdus sp. 5]
MADWDLKHMHMTFINNTDFSFTLGNFGINMKEGTVDPYPPDSIGSHETVTINARSTSLVMGLEGTITYYAQGNNGRMDIYIDMPIFGGNTFTVTFYELPDLTYTAENTTGKLKSNPIVTIKHK